MLNCDFQGTIYDAKRTCSSTQIVWHVEIPDESLAYVMGKDGSNIGTIEAQTGVTISFVDSGFITALTFLNKHCSIVLPVSRRPVMQAVCVERQQRGSCTTSQRTSTQNCGGI